MRATQCLLACAAAACVLAATPARAADAVHGQALYTATCAACHSPDYNGVGPAHRGVFGRRAGSVRDYAYSPALKGAGVTWTAANLDRWLANPEKFIPGQKMGVSVASAQDRADLIAYLQTLTTSQGAP